VVKGDDVFESEYIRTEIASHARLLFIDKSQLDSFSSIRVNLCSDRPRAPNWIGLSSTQIDR
jgi:hypothetical protein